MLPERAAYRLFCCLGFPKGCPLWHTTLLAKCSVLYLLAWLTGETGCGASCTPFAPAGKQAEFLRMGMSKKIGPVFRERRQVYESPRPSSFAPTCGQSVPKCGHTPGKVAGQQATVKAEMNGFAPGLDRRPPFR